MMNIDSAGRSPRLRFSPRMPNGPVHTVIDAPREMLVTWHLDYGRCLSPPLESAMAFNILANESL